jgi:hypothetical protein
MAYSIEDIRALDKTLQAEGETLPPPAGGMMLMGLVPADAPPLPRPISPEPHEEEVPDVEGLHAAYEAAVEVEQHFGVAQTTLKHQRDDAARRLPVLQRQRGYFCPTPASVKSAARESSSQTGPPWTYRAALSG